jgi:hypothetical protein
MTLGRIAAWQDKMLVDLKKMAATAAPITTITTMSVSG